MRFEMTFLRTVWSAAIFIASVNVNAQTNSTSLERRYALADRGTFALSMPAGWRDQVRSPGAKLPPTINFGSSIGKPFDIQVTPIWSMKADAPPPTLDEVKVAVTKTIDEVRSQAVEKKIDPVEFKSQTGQGYYFRVTDRAPKAGEYKYLAQGMFALGNLRVAFTVLTNDGQESVVQDALTMLRSARHLKP